MSRYQGWEIEQQISDYDYARTFFAPCTSPHEIMRSVEYLNRPKDYSKPQEIDYVVSNSQPDNNNN